jgi:hypothetical protein
MGCDIHGTVEVLTGSYGELEWKVISDIGDLSLRNYEMFGYLFGVRGPCQTGCARRGFPLHVTWNTRRVCSKIHDTDFHSLTYITWDELQPHMETVRSIIQTDEEYNKEWILLLDLVECLASRVSDLRLIVWFDN